MDKQLSLIILTYNSEKDIFDCLTSVYQYNDIGEALEIIVVDNNSKDWCTTELQIKEKFPNVITISNPTNGGYGQGNNVGIRASSAPIVSIMNPDVRLIMPVFGAFLKTLSAPDVVMCGGKQCLPSQKAYVSFQYRFTVHPFLKVLIFPICLRLEYYDSKRMWLQGAFFAIKKDIFSQIGLFDENIFLYEEECDIHMRLCATFPKSKIVYLADLPYIHFTENRPITYQLVERQTISQLYLCTKNNITVSQYIDMQNSYLRWNKLIGMFLNFGHWTMSKYMQFRMDYLHKMYFTK